MKPGLVSFVAVVAAALSCESRSTAPGTTIVRVDLAVQPQRPFYPVRDTARGNAKGWFDDGTSVGHANWRSLDTTVASVDTGGLIHMRGRGITAIEAEIGGKTAQVQVVVRGLLHRSITISADEIWQVADTPHVVDGLINVGSPDTTVITIQPGSRVVFRPAAGLAFGGQLWPGPARLIIPPGGAPVVMEGDVAGPGTWGGLAFAGPETSELRNVTLHGCGVGGNPCIASSASLLVQDVTVAGAPQVALALYATGFVAGSGNLTVTGGGGHIAEIVPALAGRWPAGGRYEGNADNTIWIMNGTITDSATWPVGVPWKLVGQVGVEGPANPVLRLPAAVSLAMGPGASVTVGDNGYGGLVVGDSAGPVLELAPSGGPWGNLTFADGTTTASLDHVVLRSCGAGSEDCIAVTGGSGYGTRLAVRDVSIQSCRFNGIGFWTLGQFDSTSHDLTVTGCANAPIAMPADAAASLPSGSYSGNGVDAIVLEWGGVTRDASWRNLGVPYLLLGGLTIDSGFSAPLLTLEPGVELRMGNGTQVSVLSGALRAVGTAGAPILFTSETPGVPGSWIGVGFDSSVDARSKLDHVEIRDAGANTGVSAAVRLWTDPGGLVRNTAIIRSAGCGIELFAGGWAEDYTAAATGNTFLDIVGPPTCVLP